MDIETVVPATSPLVTTRTITTMLDSIKRSGDIDLAIHLLRISLREAAQAREIWLGQLSSSIARLVKNEAESTGRTVTPSAEVKETQSTSDIAEDTPTVVQPTPKLPPTPAIATIELPPRRLLVSAQWFEAAHLLARSGSGTIWAVTEVRRLMDSELQALAEEHMILSGIAIEESIDEISRTAPIYFVKTIGGERRPFDPSRYLRHLRKTFWELSKMVTISVQQQEKRRAATRLKNARRAERDAVALRAEQEKVEAKQALRKRRDEIQEVPLALA